MTTIQESKLSMYIGEITFLNQYSAITATLPNFSAYFTTFTGNVTLIQTARLAQEADKKGVTVNKNMLKADLIAKAIDISHRVAAYATVVNNQKLFSEVNYTETDLKHCADTILHDRCKLIWDRGNTNVSSLATYGVTAALLTALQTAITAFDAAMPQPVNERSSKKQITEQLAVLFASTDSVLGKIDILVEMVKSTQPAFYETYFNNRKIGLPGFRNIALKCTVTDMNSEEPVKGASVKFSVADGQMKALVVNGKTTTATKIAKKTADKGHFVVKHMPAGNYQAVISKPGYKDQQVNVSVADGEMTLMDISLDRL